jgi:hypothetical protein
MKEMRNPYSILVGKHEGKTTLGRPGCRWKIILQWIFGKQGGKVWAGCIWFMTGNSGRPL